MFETFRAFGEVLLPIAVVAALGYAIRRAFPLDIRSLNRIAVYLLMPCLVFVTLLRAEIGGGETLRLLAVALLTAVAVLGVAMLLARPLGLEGPRRSGFVLVATFSNAGNYGLPVARFAFGEAGFQYAVVGFLTQAVLMQTLAVYVASAGHGDRRAALAQVMRLPLVYAVLAVVVLRALAIPLDESNGPLALGLYRGLRLLADATLPFMLLLLGMHLTQQQPLPSAVPLVAAASLRLLGAAVLAWAIGSALGLRGLPLHVAVVQAAMPTAVNMTIMALEFGAWPDFVGSGVIATTLASLLTLTVLLVLLM